MSDYHRETAFLRQCIRYDDTAEHHQLETRITELQRDERSVRRAVWLMALFAAMAMAGLGYAAVFLAEYPLNASQLTARFVIKGLFALGLGSLIYLVAFVGLGVVYRKELDQRRDDCRQLATKLMELRLGKPFTTPVSPPAEIQAPIINGSEAGAPALENVGRPKAIVGENGSPAGRPLPVDARSR